MSDDKQTIGSKIYETFARQYLFFPVVASLVGPHRCPTAAHTSFSSPDPGGRRKSIEHQATHGASLVDHNPPEGLLARLTSDETTKQIKSQGNNGVGMDEGLHKKAIEQQERVAERSRLHNEGLFEAHTTHEKLTNFSPEHREVADGSRLDFEVPHTYESQRV